MSYDTRYSLKVLFAGSLGMTALIRELRESYPEAAFALTESGETAEACSWYDHEDDLRAFSSRISTEYPHAVLSLDGYGEEKDDIWRKYFKDGKMQHRTAKIVFLLFDESEAK